VSADSLSSRFLRVEGLWRRAARSFGVGVSFGAYAEGCWEMRERMKEKEMGKDELERMKISHCGKSSPDRGYPDYTRETRETQDLLGRETRRPRLRPSQRPRDRRAGGPATRETRPGARRRGRGRRRPGEAVHPVGRSGPPQAADYAVQGRGAWFPGAKSTCSEN
jgi:hypothetical protein